MKLEKGSQNAKDHMKSLRDKRKMTGGRMVPDKIQNPSRYSDPPPLEAGTFNVNDPMPPPPRPRLTPIDTTRPPRIPAIQRITRDPNARNPFEGGALDKRPPMRILPQPINRRPPKQPVQSQSDTINSIQMHMGEIEKELNNLRGIEGEGIISDITDKVSDVADKTTNYITKAVESVKTAIKGRNDYPPAVRKILRTYGDKKIISAIINRKPVDGKLTSFLNVLSLGQFKKNISKEPYDDLFHLSIVLKTEDGVSIQIEKTEVIKMSLRPRKGGEMLNVTPFTGGKTLNEIMDNTQERMGAQFFTYSARNNNCQDFITALLKSNSMGDTNDFTFVKQDANQMFKGLGTLSKVADYITDLGGKVDVIMKGKGDLIR